jgi:DNA-binding transcriptional regulator YiaG
MPNIAAVLKSEIARVARKEIRAEVEPLKKAGASYRHEIATLRKKVLALEKQLKRTSRQSSKERAVPAPEEGDKQLRFSAARFAAQRKKLGLSAAAFAQLLGVSSLSVYKWESGKTRPRQAQLKSIAAIRTLGKREAQARLAMLNEGN